MTGLAGPPRRTLAPWHLRLAATGAGAASILSQAPFFVWPILWVTLPALLWLLAQAADRAPLREPRWAPWHAVPIGRAAAVGWWFGFGYHLAGLFWVGEAFLVEVETFGWLLPFAVVALPAGLALFTAAAAAIACGIGRGASLRAVALAVGFGLTEFLRGHILTGFPWNVLGYALTTEPFLQSAAVFGVYGLTVVSVLVFTLPVVWWQDGRRLHAVAMALLPLVALAGLGQATPEIAAAPDAPRIRIVQPSVVQREKWRPEHQRRIFDLHLTLSHTTPDRRVDGAAQIDLVVWPEAAMPFVPLAEPVALAEIGALLSPQTTLAAGALRVEPALAPATRRRVYNSLLLFGGGPSAVLHATYDKTHLVPFGEYLPLQALMSRLGLRGLAEIRGGFTPGAEPRPLLDVPRVGRLAPLICYEAIFPGRVVQASERPRGLLAVTNDGWFGDTTGPRQHLHMARVRAVEEGLPVIRAANNGISAMIDAHGRIVGRLDMNVVGTLDARLPPALASTFYARHRDLAFWLLLAGLASFLIGRGRADTTRA